MQNELIEHGNGEIRLLNFGYSGAGVQRPRVYLRVKVVGRIGVSET